MKIMSDHLPSSSSSSLSEDSDIVFARETRRLEIKYRKYSKKVQKERVASYIRKSIAVSVEIQYLVNCRDSHGGNSIEIYFIYEYSKDPSGARRAVYSEDSDIKIIDFGFYRWLTRWENIKVDEEMEEKLT